MWDYTQSVIFGGFKTLFTSTETGIADPSVRQGGLERRHNGRQRSFFLYELGSWDEEEGYWAGDEEDETLEGFLDINNEIFWSYNPETDQWDDAYVAGFKRFRNKGRGKGKGRRYRSTFRGRFRPVKHKRGKAHLTENDYDSWDYPAQNELQDGDGSYFGKGKPRSKGGKNKSKGRSSYGEAKAQDRGTFKASGKSKKKGGKKGK